jgi:acetyltransferase-like isoleucine patch superfamily enzyme
MPIAKQGTTPGGTIRIGEGCRIGNRVAILCDRGELLIGRNCIIAPGAVVTHSFPANSVLAGNPARIVSKLDRGQTRTQSTPLRPPDKRWKPGEAKSSGVDPAMLANERQEKSTTPRDIAEGLSIRTLIRILRQDMKKADPARWLLTGANKLRALWVAHSYPFVSFGEGTWMHYSWTVARSSAPNISIGNNVGFARGARLDVASVRSMDAPILIMEEGSSMQRRAVISARNHIHVMKDTMLGFSVLVIDHRCVEEDGGIERDSKSGGGTIKIEEGCWIGSGAVIVCEEGELTVGRHSVVGANTVITRSIPPYSVVAGECGRIVKQYDFVRGKWVLGCVRQRGRKGQEEPSPTASISV